MKAIHNDFWMIQNIQATVFNISKIQNESNSQRAFVGWAGSTYCVQYFKDTK